MENFKAEWDVRDIGGALKLGFSFFEIKDKIVGFVYAHPSIMKSIILAAPEDIQFDYIPEGIGLIRTAYLKLKFGRANELIFVDQENSEEVIITLK